MTGVDGVSDQVRDADRDLKAIWGAIGGLDRKIKGVSLSIHQAVQEFKKTIEDDRRRAAIQTPMGDRTVTEPYSHRQNHRGQNQGVPYQKLSGVFEHDLCNFKKRVPSFNGTLGTNHVLDWIDVVDDYFDETNPPEALKCKLAATKLKGEARKWWMELQSHRLSEGKCLISSWPNLSELLYCRFSPTNCSTKFPSQLNEQKEAEMIEPINVDEYIPAKYSTNVPSELHSSKWERDEVKESKLLNSVDVCEGENEAETGDQRDVMLGELKKCAIEGQKGGVVHEAKTDSCKVNDCDLQETPDLEVVKLKWKCTTVYKGNSQPLIGATMSPYLSQKWSIGSIYDVEVKGQTWESQKDGTATESVVRLQPNSLMPKAGLCEVDDYMKLTYLVFGSTLLRVKRLSDAKFMTGVIPLMSFDPGGKGRNRTKTIYGHEMGQGNVLTVAPSCLGNTGIHKVGNAKEEQSRIRLLNESDLMNGGTLYSSFDPGGRGINEARKCSSKPVMANVHFQALNHSLERLHEEFANINVHAFLSFDPGGIIYSLKTWNSVSCPRSKTCILFVVNMHTGGKASDMPCSKSCMLGTMEAILYIGYNEASEAMSIIPKQLFDPSMVSSPCFYDVISESKLFVRMMNEMFHVIGGVDWRTYYCYVTDRRNNLHFLESVYELMHLGPEDFESLRDLKGYGYCSTKMAPQVDQLIPIEFYGLFLVYAELFTELCDAFMFKPALRKMISIQVQFVRKEMLGPRDYIGLLKEHAHMCEFVEVGTVRNGTSQLWMLHSWYETYIKLVVLLFDPGGSTYSSNTWGFKNCIFSCSNMIDGSIEDSSNLKVKASLTTHGDDIDSLAIASNVCHVFQMKLDIFVDLCKTNNVGGTFDQSASGLIVHEHGMDILPAYAFGVVLIDFLSDENPIENIYRKGFEILVYWAETSLKEGKAGDVGMFTFDPGGRDSDTLKGQLQSLFYLCLESRKLICMQKDTSLSLNDENDFNTRGVFTVTKLSVITFFSWLKIVCEKGQFKKTLKLFHDVVNGLDPPMKIDGVCWVFQWIGSCPGLSMLLTLVVTGLLTNQHLVKFNSRTSLLFGEGWR